MFSVQTVGVRPAYIDATWPDSAVAFPLFRGWKIQDIASQKKKRTSKTDAAPQKVKFDQAYVKILGKNHKSLEGFGLNMS